MNDRKRQKDKKNKIKLQLKSTIHESLAFNLPQQPDPAKVIHFPIIPLKQKAKLPDRTKRLRTLYNQIQSQEDQAEEQKKSQDRIITQLKQQDEEDEPFDCLPHGKVGRRQKNPIVLGRTHSQSDQYKKKLINLERQMQDNIKKYSRRMRFNSNKNSKVQSLGKVCTGKEKENTVARQDINDRIIMKNTKFKENEQCVDLSNMKLAQAEFRMIHDRLTRCLQLSKLNLSFNQLTNKSIPLLISLMESIKLEELSLRWNQISDDGALPLFTHLRANKTLLHLDLSYNSLSSQKTSFVEAVRQFLVENKTLLHINLEMCRLSHEHCRAIAENYNFRNQTIAGMHFKGNGNYCVNAMGYIVEKDKEETIQLQNRKKIAMTKSQSQTSIKAPQKGIKAKSKELKLLPEVLQRYVSGVDCCWYCSNWIVEQFKYYRQIQPGNLHPTFQPQIFIHLDCYDYHPIRLDSSSCLAPRKKTIRISKSIDWRNFEIYSVVLPVPADKDAHFFYSCEGSIYLSPQDKHIAINLTISFKITDLFSHHCLTQIGLSFPQQKKYSVYLTNINVRDHQNFYVNCIKLQKQQCREKQLQNKRQDCHTRTIKNIIRKSISQKNNSEQNEIGAKQGTQDSNKKVEHKTSLKYRIDLHLRKITKGNIEESSQLLQFHSIPRKKLQLYKLQTIKKFQQILEIENSEQATNRMTSLLEQTHKYFDFNFKRLDQSRFITKVLIQRQKLAFEKQTYFTECFYLANRSLNNHDNCIAVPNKENQLLSDNKNKENALANKNKTVKVQTHVQSKKGKGKFVRFMGIDQDQSELQMSKSMHQVQSSASTPKYPATEIGISSQKYIIRCALSLTLIYDQGSLKKEPISVLSNIDQCALTTKYNLKPPQSIKYLQSIPLLKMSFERKPFPICQLKDDLMSKYFSLMNNFIRQKCSLADLVKSKHISKDQLKQVNETITTYNYSNMCHYLDRIAEKVILQQIEEISEISQLSRYIQQQKDQIQESKVHIHGLQLLFSSFKNQQKNTKKRPVTTNSNQDDSLNQPSIHNQIYFLSHGSLNSYGSLVNFLTNDNHPLKHSLNNKIQVSHSSKKRQGKYGRSLKNSKESLLGDGAKKVVLPASSVQLLAVAQREKQMIKYNNFVRELNFISEVFWGVVDEIVKEYQEKNDGEKHKKQIEIYQWIREQGKQKINRFAVALKQQNKDSTILSKAVIFQSYFMYSLIELCKFALLLNGSDFKEIGKNKFIYHLFNYENILSEQTHKCGQTILILQQNPQMAKDIVNKVINLLAKNWRHLEQKIYFAENTAQEKGMPQEINHHVRSSCCLLISKLKNTNEHIN